MMTADSFMKLVLSFPGTEQVPHFERVGFKVPGRRMFATYLDKDNTVNVFLSPKEQHEFCKLKNEGISPVPNKWGEKGATTFELKLVTREILQEALSSAYEAAKGKRKKLE